MKVELRNIGPINRAEIDLDGLAVLVGPNASGKTTLSTAAYAVLLSHRATEFRLPRVLDQATLSRPGRGELTDVDQLGEWYAAAFRESLTREFERCYTPDLSKLPRRGRTGNGSAPRIIVSHRPPGDAPWKLVFRIREGSLTLEPKHPEYLLPEFDRLLEATAEHTSRAMISRASMSRRRGLAQPIYFPAARSGYVQMQSVLSSLLIAALGRGYFDQISVGKISGVAADFLQFLAEMDPSAESVLPDSASVRLEEELLHGHLRLSASETAKIIEFAPNGLDEYWPMDSAATSIAELAPLLLYLRHRARPQDLLFIDEPEAHLHPRNQLVLADVLLELSGLIRGMVVGTHSDFFVTGLSNGILRRQGDVDASTLPVALYELVDAPATGGYVAAPREVDRNAGFNVDQFSDVAEQALDEAEDLFDRRQRAEA
jgi:energy-coupling factor transporter ATP-binding protein EcfA2